MPTIPSAVTKIVVGAVSGAVANKVVEMAASRGSEIVGRLIGRKRPAARRQPETGFSVIPNFDAIEKVARSLTRGAITAVAPTATLAIDAANSAAAQSSRPEGRRFPPSRPTPGSAPAFTCKCKGETAGACGCEATAGADDVDETGAFRFNPLLPIPLMPDNRKTDAAHKKRVKKLEGELKALEAKLKAQIAKSQGEMKKQLTAQAAAAKKVRIGLPKMPPAAVQKAEEQPNWMKDVMDRLVDKALEQPAAPQAPQPPFYGPNPYGYPYGYGPPAPSPYGAPPGPYFAPPGMDPYNVGPAFLEEEEDDGGDAMLSMLVEGVEDDEDDLGAALDPELADAIGDAAALDPELADAIGDVDEEDDLGAALDPELADAIGDVDDEDDLGATLDPELADAIGDVDDEDDLGATLDPELADAIGDVDEEDDLGAALDPELADAIGDVDDEDVAGHQACGTCQIT